MKDSFIWIDPERMGGTPCFRGTRVPVKALFDYLGGGHPLDDFLDDFPTVTRDQAVGVLGSAGRSEDARALAEAA